MDTRSDRGQFYPGGATSSVPAGGASDKVDRVDVGEIGASYTLKDVKNKVNQIVRVLAPAAVGCLVLSAWCLVLGAGAATGVLEDLPNTAPVVTNEEDAVAMAAVGDLRLEIEDLRFATNALDNAWRSGTNRLQATILERQSEATNALVGRIMSASNNLQSSIFNLQSQLPNYALKSELPTDYIRENDITNFATRSWISAQGYASGAEITARLDAQDNAIGTATNAQNTAVSTASNALAQAHAADMAALRIGTNRLDQAWRTGTNVLAQAHRTDIAALKSGTNTLAVTLRQATNALAIAHRADVLSLRTATTTASNALAQAHAADIAALRMGTNRLDQAWRTGTNALAQAHRTDIAALKSGTNTLAVTLRHATNALAQVHRADITALKSGTNTLATTLRQATNALARADARLEAKIDALELTGGMTRLWSSDATTFQDATGVVWQVHKDWLYTMSGTNYTAEQMGSNFDGGYLSWEEDFEYEGPYGTNEVFTGWFVNDGSGTSPLGYWNEDWSGATNANLTSAQYQFAMQQVVARRAFTNAVTRVAYTNDVAAVAAVAASEAVERLEEMGTVFGAWRLRSEGGVDDVAAPDVWRIAQAGTNYTDAATNALAQSGIGQVDLSPATNYTDAVAAEFEDGTRTVVNANYAGTASDAMVAYKVSGDEWYDQYNANDLMRASTNAAKAVVAPAAVAATNYTDAALGRFAETGTVARASVYGTPTRWTDATGCVWEASVDWRIYTNGIVAVGWTAWSRAVDAGLFGTSFDLVVGLYENEENPRVANGVFPEGVAPHWGNEYEAVFDWNYDFYGLTRGDTIRAARDETNLVGRVALTNDIVETEEDPTVPAWAKEPSKPTYSASEVGAYPATAGAEVAGVVSSWEAYWGGSNVTFEVTNYYNATSGELPRLRIREFRNGTWTNVWDEADKFQVCEAGILRAMSATNDALKVELATNFAPIAWGTVSDKGNPNPVANSTYMASPETYFGGGTEFQRIAVGSGSICVLVDRGALAKTAGEPGTFRFQDLGGTNYFGFSKSESYTIGCRTDGISVDAGMVTLKYDVIMSGTDVPVVYYKQTLADPAWVQLNETDGTETAGAPYSVTWSQSGGSYFAHINCGSEPSGFFTAETAVAGDVVFETNMRLGAYGGIACTNTATGKMGVVRPSYNGSTVTWSWSEK